MSKHCNVLSRNARWFFLRKDARIGIASFYKSMKENMKLLETFFAKIRQMVALVFLSKIELLYSPDRF